MKIIRSAYSQREPVNNPVSGLPTRTKQEFIKEVDINQIVAKMRQGIQPAPWMTSATPHYGDFDNMPASFMEAYAIVEEGEAAFKSLPLEFRRALDHDPRNLDKAPRELYEKFGLLKSKASEASSNESSLSLEDAPQGHPTGGPKGSQEPKKAAKKAAENTDQ